jgi:hypothetical protein
MDSADDQESLEERLNNLEAIVALLQTDEDSTGSVLPPVEPQRPAPANPMPHLVQHFADFRTRAIAFADSFRDFSWDSDAGPPPAPERAPVRAPDPAPAAELVLEKPRKRNFPTFFLPDSQTRLAFAAPAFPARVRAPP